MNFRSNREFLRGAPRDLSDFYHIPLVVTGLVGGLQGVGLSGGLEYASCDIIVVESVKLSLSQVGPLRLSPVYISHAQYISHLKMLLYLRPGPLNIAYPDLIPYELGRCGRPVLDHRQLILRVQGIRGRPRRHEPLALRLRPGDIVVPQVVLGLLQLEVQGTRPCPRDVPVLPEVLRPVTFPRQLPRLRS